MTDDHDGAAAIPRAKALRRPKRAKLPTALLDEALRLIAEGHSLRAASAQVGISQSALTMRAWQEPELFARYERARQIAAEAVASRVMDTAEDVLSSRVTPDQGRVAIDAMKWTAGRMSPRRYGPPAHTQVTTAVVGEVVTEVRRVLVDGSGEDDQ